MSEDWKPILDQGRSEQNRNWEFVKLIIIVILVIIIIIVIINISIISDSCEIPYLQLVQLDLLLNGGVWRKILEKGHQCPFFKKSFFGVLQNTLLHYICNLKNCEPR